MAETFSESPEARQRRYAYEDTTGYLMTAAARFGRRDTTDWNDQANDSANHADVWEWTDSPAGEHILYAFTDSGGSSYQEIVIAEPSARMLEALKNAGLDTGSSRHRSIHLVVYPPNSAQNSGAEVVCSLQAEPGNNESPLHYEQFDALAEEGGLLESPSPEPSRRALRARRLAWTVLERLASNGRIGRFFH